MRSLRWKVRETPFLAVDDGWEIPLINTSEEGKEDSIPLQNLGDNAQAYMYMFAHFMNEIRICIWRRRR